MWFWLAFASSVLLGLYDVAKKQALRKNDIWFVLFGATVLTVLFLCPFLGKGTPGQHLRLALKAVLVTTSWVSGMIALKLLPITVVSPLKATRPLFVILFSIVLFGERMNPWQWAGTAVMLAAIWLLSVSGQKEGIRFFRNKGIWAMGVSILSGVASALYDKHIMSALEPLFVQSWTNLFITLLLALCVLVSRLVCHSERSEESVPPFRWDWTLLLVAVLITGADMLYFFSLKQPDALLSIISTVRRTSIIVTFVCGALLFREGNIREKSLNLLMMAAGLALLLIGSA